MAFINQNATNNLIYTDFNNDTRPWKVNTTYLYHNPALVTDFSYLQPFSAIGADTNNLFIEAVNSDIKFLVNSSNKIEFNGNVKINNNFTVINDISCCNLFVDTFIDSKNTITSRNNLVVFNDLSINRNLLLSNDMSCSNILVNNELRSKQNIKTNRLTVLSDISVNRDVYVNNNIDLSGDITVFGDIYKINHSNNTPEKIFDASFEQLREKINLLLDRENLSTF